jgi:hypothetical protein
MHFTNEIKNRKAVTNVSPATNNFNVEIKT